MRAVMTTLSLWVVTVLTSPALASTLSEPLPAALTKVKAGEAIIVDVREAEEIKDGMIEQAIWLPTSEIAAKTPRYETILKSLPKDKPIYLYCAVGVRAEAFSDQLEAQGYTAVSVGGLPELVVAGFTTKPVPDAKTQPCPYLCAAPAAAAVPAAPAVETPSSTTPAVPAPAAPAAPAPAPVLEKKKK